MTGDLVDCSAATEPGEWKDARLEEISAALCEPFDIGVSVGDGIDTGEPFARFRIEEAESVFRGHRPSVPFPRDPPAVGRQRRFDTRWPVTQPDGRAAGAWS